MTIRIQRKAIIDMSTLQKQVIQSLNGLSDDNLSKATADRNSIRRIGSLEGQNLIDADYDIDDCNDEIAEMFGVK